MPTRPAFLVALAAGCCFAAAVLADEPPPPPPSIVAPSEFGFSIPSGPVRSTGDRRVLVTDEQGERVVGRIYATVGDNAIVLLPDGTLVARRPSEFESTDRPFAPASKEDLARRLTEGAFQGYRTRTSKRYLFVYNTSEEFALATSRILETLCTGVIEFCKNQRLDTSEPELPLVVLMFKNEDDFQAYRRMPAGVMAYYNVLDNRIALYEETELIRTQPALGLQQAISTIAHEGTHQVLHNVGVQKRLSVWPMWIAEGIAEYLAPTETGKNLRWKGVGQVNDLRMFELERYIKSRSAAAADGAMLDDTVQAGRLTSTGYAAAWSLTHFLAQQERVKFQRFLKEVSQLGPFEGEVAAGATGVVPANRALFQRHFGTDFALLERRLVAHLKKQDYNAPFAQYPHFVAMIESGPPRKTRREADVFLSATDAARWQRETLAKIPDAVRPTAQVALRRFANRDQAEAFATAWMKGH